MRLTYKAGLLALLLAVFTVGSALAQEEGPDSVTRLMQFAANNGEFDGAVEARAQALFKTQIESCKAPEKAVRQLPTPYGEIEFPPDPKRRFPYPTKGVWAEHVKIKGCNALWSINMLAVARDGDRPPLLLALMPGDTLGDPAVQRNAERIGATTIKKADAESCAADAYATYTKVLGYVQEDGSVGKKDAGKGWFEEWAYRFCQRDIPVQMVYLPNTKGGYDIKARIVPDAMPKVPAPKPDAAKPEADTKKPAS